MSETLPKVAMVVGVGPGLGAALVHRFARGGYAVAMVARRADALGAIARAAAAQVPGARTLAVTADAADAAAVTTAFERTRGELGAPEVLVFNAGAFARGGVHELTPEQFEACWRANCLGGFLCARAALPAMLERGRGTVIFTGATASRRGSAGFAALAVGKFGLRALAESMAREYAPRGIHVAHVVVDGVIDTPNMRAMMPGRDAATLLAPVALAETYWQLHVQHPTTWTFELDVRPAPEKF